MFAPMRYPQGQYVDPWRLVRVAADADPSAGEYGLLDPRLAEDPELPREGLLSEEGLSGAQMPEDELPDLGAKPTPPHRVVSSDAAGGMAASFGVEGVTAPSVDDFNFQDLLRGILGLSPARHDLIEDERGNLLPPEVSDLIQDIGAATKANELALRRRINEMFQGESRTAYWFHVSLSDILAGDPPEDILHDLSYRADQRFRDQRSVVDNFSSFVGAPAAAAQPGSRPFTHLNSPVPHDPDMATFRQRMREYRLNQLARAEERANVDPALLKHLEGKHWNYQGEEFEGVARGFDTAYGRIIGPRLKVERPDASRIYDYVLLNRLGALLNPVEAKSGQGRIPKNQRLFDATMTPPVVYRKEIDVLRDGEKMLNAYDRLWLLRNPLPPANW